MITPPLRDTITTGDGFRLGLGLFLACLFILACVVLIILVVATYSGIRLDQLLQK